MLMLQVWDHILRTTDLGKWSLKGTGTGEFPNGLVIRTQHFEYLSLCSTPASSHRMLQSKKKKKKKEVKKMLKLLDELLIGNFIIRLTSSDSFDHFFLLDLVL